MNWSDGIKRSALKDLSRITKSERLRLVAAIDDLAQNPYRGSALKGELTGLRRIRVGSYRVIYEIRESEFIILVVCQPGIAGTSTGRREPLGLL